MTKSSSIYWPKGLSKKLLYKYGEKPLHAYLEEHAKRKPNLTAYNFYGNILTWSKLNDDINRLAQFLKEQGIKKKDRVALYMQNCPQYIIGYFSIQKIGAVVIPLNPMYKSAELEYFINEVEVKAVILTDDLFVQLRDIKNKIPSVDLWITTNYKDYLPKKPTLPTPKEMTFKKKYIEGTLDFVTVIKKTDVLQEETAIKIWEDVCLMAFTSGTTGRPKAAMLTYGNALFKAASSASSFGFTEKDKTIVIPPLVHIGGKVIGINIPIYSGCESVLLTRFDPEATIQAIERYKINLLYSLPTMNVAIMEHPSIDKSDLSSLKTNYATSFGIPVTEKLANEWREATKGCEMYEATYGLSETHDVDTFMPKDKVKFGSVGIPTFNTEIKIIDLKTGKELKEGEQGEIVIKSPGVFRGYYKREQDTAETLKDGWLYTGDIGSFDDDGYLYLHGRVKELIKSSGYSVFPEDVESLLERHEAILQVAVIGVPDEKRGQSVKAFIVLKDEYKGNVTDEEIIQWSKENMAAYKYPRHIAFKDHLPESISGKVLRKHLQEQE